MNFLASEHIPRCHKLSSQIEEIDAVISDEPSSKKIPSSFSSLKMPKNTLWIYWLASNFSQIFIAWVCFDFFQRRQLQLILRQKSRQFAAGFSKKLRQLIRQFDASFLFLNRRQRILFSKFDTLASKISSISIVAVFTVAADFIQAETWLDQQISSLASKISSIWGGEGTVWDDEIP